MNDERAEQALHQDTPLVELRAVDLVVVFSCACAALLLLGPFRWAPGAGSSAFVFAVFALGPLLLRTLETYGPRKRVVSFIADFWMLPVVSVGHGMLGPLVSAVTPGLKDARIVALDQHLFGAQASVVLGEWTPRWLMDVLLVCYYGHFLWPLALGCALYFAQRREAFDEYLLALGLFFACNFVFYTWVPAIGPRFFLHAAFPGSLQGLWLTPYLESAMLQPTFVRDCFPSGHTGAALLVLVYAWRFERRVFRVAFLPVLGLIAATLVGRFHYATDLVCAVPLVVGAVAVAAVWSRWARGSLARQVPWDVIVRS
ncbi:phosphatase PAP2 family protein [Archangium primigenium]|uniref:phosphatase PAP2 family protein n=1 Tax=[Archangium] primigenium TaxID=2792470 RepID=UPI0030846329